MAIFRQRRGGHRRTLCGRSRRVNRRRVRDLPGSELFQYLDDDGERHSIDSGDVNDDLREIAGADITAKDFRTWAATSVALLALARHGDEAPTKKVVVEMVQEGRTAWQYACSLRQMLLHPAVIDSFATGKLAPFVALLRVGAAAAQTARAHPLPQGEGRAGGLGVERSQAASGSAEQSRNGRRLGAECPHQLPSDYILQVAMRMLLAGMSRATSLSFSMTRFAGSAALPSGMRREAFQGSG